MPSFISKGLDFKKIEQNVTSFLEQSLACLSKEHQKIDFKREWRDPKTEDGIMAFAVD